MTLLSTAAWHWVSSSGSGALELKRQEALSWTPPVMGATQMAPAVTAESPHLHQPLCIDVVSYGEGNAIKGNSISELLLVAWPAERTTSLVRPLPSIALIPSCVPRVLLT